MMPSSSSFGVRRSAVASCAAVLAALLWAAPAAAQTQPHGQSTVPDQDSASASGRRHAFNYQYLIQNGPGQNGFRLEVKQTSPGAPPEVTVNGERIDLDSTGSKRIELPNGGHITISQGANGQVRIQDGIPNRLFAFGGDMDSVFNGKLAKEMQRAQRELARVQREFGRMWQGMPGGATIQIPGVCGDTASTDTTSSTGPQR